MEMTMLIGIFFTLDFSNIFPRVTRESMEGGEGRNATDKNKELENKSKIALMKVGSTIKATIDL